MKFTVQQIADILEGTIVGDSETQVSKLSKIEEGEAGSISFLSNTKYTPFIYTTKASAVIVNADFVPDQSVSTTLIQVEDSYSAFTKLLEYYQMIKLNKSGIEQPSFMHESVVKATVFT